MVTFEVGDRSCDTPHSAQAARRESARYQRAFEERLGIGMEGRRSLQRNCRELGVAPHPAFMGTSASAANATGDDRGRLGTIGAEQLPGIGSVDIDAQVEAIEEGSRQPAAVPLECTIRTPARRGNDPLAAWTWIHRPDEEEAGGQFDARLGASEPDHAFFERLPE